MVDPYTFQNASLDTSDDARQHDTNYEFAKMVARQFKGRANLIRKFSVFAAEGFLNNELDFVYIDARHDFRSVWADLCAWYPVVKSGGIIAGHDYKNSLLRGNLVEVKTAVDKFFFGREPVFVTTDDGLESWYVTKQ